MELQIIQNKIFEIRGIRVILDFDLAELYEVETRALKQAVKRYLHLLANSSCDEPAHVLDNSAYSLSR